MKKILAAFLALILTVSVGLGVCYAQYLPAPRSETILPGTTEVGYAGQTIVFNTPVKLFVRFQAMGWNRIEITILKVQRPPRGDISMAPSQPLRIYWQEGDELLYEGSPPPGGWSGTLLTEGGLTEK